MTDAGSTVEPMAADFYSLEGIFHRSYIPMTWNIEYTDRYKENIPRADALYDQHLALVKQEGINDGEEIL
jgi:hypothetical protein